MTIGTGQPATTVSKLFGADAGGEAEVARVAGHLLADGGDAHDGDAIALADVNGVVEVGDGLGLGGGIAGGDHDGHGGGVHADGVLHVNDDVVVELGEDGGAGVGAEADGDVLCGGDDGAEDAAGAHEAVGVLQQGDDGEVDALDAAGGAHDEAVVAGEHEGAAVLGVEDAREAVLHAPVQVGAALEGEADGLLGGVEAERGGFLEVVHVRHRCGPFVG